jgi:hypothetical protein
VGDGTGRGGRVQRCAWLHPTRHRQSTIIFADAAFASPLVNVKNGMRVQDNFVRQFKLIWVVQSFAQKYFA